MVNRYLHTIIFVITFTAHASPFENQHEKTLCVDIGGTRIKAAVLHNGMSLDELKSVPVITLPSKEWLNESLPELFNASTAKSLAALLPNSYTRISFGITGPVMNSRLYINPFRFSIPRELAHHCKAVAHMPVSLENDTTMWVLGALSWLSLTDQVIHFPCLCITLGTGVGIAVLKSPADIALLEISFLNTPFTRLHALSLNQPIKIEYGRKSPHEPIGEKFFDWAHTCSWDRNTIQSVFNNRVIAFCEDIQEYIEQEMSISPHTILIGGGNSRFIMPVQMKDILRKEIILLSPRAIAQHGVSRDIISLLGCMHSLDGISVYCIPPIETIFPVNPKPFSPC